MQKQKRPNIPKSVKEIVKLRDGNICRMCGGKFEDKFLDFDHKTPHSKGGPATVDNIQRVCHPCNLKKGNKTPKCSKCGDWIVADASYCQRCGTRQKVKPLQFQKSKSDLSWRIRNLIRWLLIILAIYLILVGLKVIK